MKKSSKKPIVVATHPATKFLNHNVLEELRIILKDKENIYERFHELHIKGKERRGNVCYLTREEIMEFIKENCQGDYETYPNELKNTLKICANAISGALNWKQFQQVYRFQPELLNELWDIDFEDSKYETLSMSELEFLPCFSFYVECPMDFFDNEYEGFFVYFDTHDFLNDIYGLQVMFISKPIPVKYGDKATHEYNVFNMTLSYDFSSINICEKETGKTFTVNAEPKEMLRLLNPHTFEQLGEERALEIIIKINQIITYLACSNADFTLVKKATRKPDLKRTHISDLEHTEYRLGDTYARLASGKSVNTRYLGDNPEAYTKSEEVEVNENPTEREVGYRKTGYHVRPHMRKAHWQSFWYGKKDGSEERVKRRKFVSAVFVNNTGEEIEMPTREIVRLRF